MGILQVQVLFEGWVRLERRGLQGRFSRASFPSLSAARAGTHSTVYSVLGLNCRRSPKRRPCFALYMSVSRSGSTGSPFFTTALRYHCASPPALLRYCISRGANSDNDKKLVIARVSEGRHVIVNLMVRCTGLDHSAVKVELSLPFERARTRLNRFTVRIRIGLGGQDPNCLLGIG